MPGPLTYAAITLLARDRIGQIRRALEAKKRAGHAKELDLHMLYLATQAEDMMSATLPVIPPPVRLYGPPLTDHISRFTLLGAVGPDLTRYGAYFAEGNRWLFDTLHKGTPDTDRERVLTNSTNLVFEFWRRVTPLIDSGPEKDLEKRKQAKQKMQAYALGHLCHIAADVLSHPYFESLESRLSAPADASVIPTIEAIPYLTRDDIIGTFDVHISKTFFGRGADTRTKQWADWFPTTGDVPDAFGQAMSDAIIALYGETPVGMPAFDETFKKIDPAPPGMSAAFMNESVSSFRNLLEIERVWDLGDWLGMTSMIFLPMAFAYFGATALPHGGDLSTALTAADGPDAAAVRLYESIVYPVAVSAVAPLCTMIIVTASGRGLGAEGITGWIQVGLSLAAAVGFFASLGGAGAARWTLFFVIPLVLAVAQMIFVLARGATENVRKLLFIGPITQIVLALLFMLLYQVWLHNGVEQFNKDGDINYLEAFGDFVAWLAIIVALWFGVSLLFRYVFSSTVPDDQDSLAKGEPRQFLALYDDMALVRDPSATANPENLGALSYPPARRPLLKLWWTAGTELRLQLHIDKDQHDRLNFRWPGPPLLDQLVFAPMGTMTVERFGQLLAASVTGDAAKGTLNVAPVRADEKDIELAPGSVFSDAGDDKTKRVDHDTIADAFSDVSIDATAPTILYHTPRPRLAERMGRTGVAGNGKRIEQAAKANSKLKIVVGQPRQFHVDVDDASSPFLRRLFVPGDIVEIDNGVVPGEKRVVEQVLNDTDIVVASPFLFAIPGAGVAFKRAASNRGVRQRIANTITVPSTVTTGVGPNDVIAVAPFTPFGAELRAGDLVEIVYAPVAPPGVTPLPVRRTIVAVKDDIPATVPPLPFVLELDAPAPVLAGLNASLDRLSDAEADGVPYFADASDVFGDGVSVMNDAADLAALLCLGGASRLAIDGTTATPAGATKPVHRVSQVFRNWNLDRRRVNEWKLMVSGGAESDRKDDLSAAEEAAPFDPLDAGESLSAALVTQRRAADLVVREQGWLGVFRGWVDMASRARTDTTSNEVFKPGMPSNADLSRAMAYLIDAAEGVTP